MFWLLIVLPVPLWAGNTCTRITSTTQRRMSGHAFAAIPCTGIAECLYTCMCVRDCESVNWRKTAHICDLNDKNSMTAKDSMVTMDMDYSFFDISSWPASLAGDCADHTCGHTKRCVPGRRCVTAFCPAATPVVANSLIDSTGNRTVGVLRMYQCHNYYTINGTGSISCQPNGTWSAPAFQCIPGCLSLYQAGYLQDGVYEIGLEGVVSVSTWCDMTNGGWTVIQRRQDGSVDFYRGWNDYVTGFGDPSGEFWLGLDAIHRLTIQPSELDISMETFPDQIQTSGYAAYTTFQVENEASNFRLTIDGYSGDCGPDAMAYHNGQMFSTKDRDNDNATDSCSYWHKGGWWYNYCVLANLNGYYFGGITLGDGVIWVGCWDYGYSLKSTVMKVRPKQ